MGDLPAGLLLLLAPPPGTTPRVPWKPTPCAPCNEPTSVLLRRTGEVLQLSAWRGERRYKWGCVCRRECGWGWGGPAPARGCKVGSGKVPLALLWPPLPSPPPPALLLPAFLALLKKPWYQCVAPGLLVLCGGCCCGACSSEWNCCCCCCWGALWGSALPLVCVWSWLNESVPDCDSWRAPAPPSLTPLPLPLPPTMLPAGDAGDPGDAEPDRLLRLGARRVALWGATKFSELRPPPCGCSCCRGLPGLLLLSGPSSAPVFRLYSIAHFTTSSGSCTCAKGVVDGWRDDGSGDPVPPGA